MEHKKIQFLVPQYKENEETISFLLDSIESQLHIDKNDVGVNPHSLNPTYLKITEAEAKLQTKNND